MITVVDVGATKTLVAQFNQNAELINRVRFETPHIAADFVRTLLRHLEAFKDISSLAIGVAGQVSTDKETILYCGNLPWRNIPLKTMLRSVYKCPIFIENDAAMAGLGEINALAPLPKLGFYIGLGTGIGCSIIVNGKLLPGLDRTEAGHILLNVNETWKEWEDIASGKAIVGQFHKLAQELTQPEQWQWFAENLAQGLLTIVPLLQPEAIVIGGGVGKHFDMFHGILLEKLHRRLPDYIAVPTFHVSRHADDAVLFGCYYHATHRLDN